MKNLRKILFTIGIIGLFIFSSSNNFNTTAKHIYDKTEEVLITMDKKFSEKSQRDGILSAFLEYASDDVVIFREKFFPIIGKKELKETYKSEFNNDDILILTPTEARISESKDLGYTYGEWNYISAKGEKFGYYVTVWKKQEDGNWKIVLYSGNSSEAGLTKFRKLN